MKIVGEKLKIPAASLDESDENWERGSFKKIVKRNFAKCTE